MVAHSRAPLGAAAVRPLSVNAPIPLQVQVDRQGRPLAVRKPRWPRPRPVAQIQDRWRIDDEWWRDHPISRIYHLALLADGTLLTFYHDLIANLWFEQRDASGAEEGEPGLLVAR